MAKLFQIPENLEWENAFSSLAFILEGDIVVFFDITEKWVYSIPVHSLFVSLLGLFYPHITQSEFLGDSMNPQTSKIKFYYQKKKKKGSLHVSSRSDQLIQLLLPLNGLYLRDMEEEEKALMRKRPSAPGW